MSAIKNDGNNLLPLSERNPLHIVRLKEIIIRWAGSSRHATWLVIQSAFYKGITYKTTVAAKEVLFECLQNNDVCSYAKYRLLHHLRKLRKGKNGNYRFLDSLSESEKKQLEETLQNIIKEPAFELNITGLYILKVMGYTVDKLKESVRKYLPKPVGEPIKNALSYISDNVLVNEYVEMVSETEPDEFSEFY